jgi:hypothetical protein
MAGKPLTAFWSFSHRAADTASSILLICRARQPDVAARFSVVGQFEFLSQRLCGSHFQTDPLGDFPAL